MIRDVMAALFTVALAGSAAACFEDATPIDATGPGDGSGPDDTGDGGTASSGSVDPDGSSDADTGPDATCPAGFSCAAAVPADWNGPVARFIGPEATVPDCGGDYPYAILDVRSGLQASPAQCSACACDEPTSVLCQGPELRFFESLMCDGSPPLQFDLGAHDECVTFGELGISTPGMESDPVVQIRGTGVCTATGGEATLPEPGWTNLLRACGGAPDAGACGEAGTCLPTPGNPLAPGVCIWTLGDRPCPAGPYALRNVFYEDYDDVRACTTCSCGDASGASCHAIVEVHANLECSNLRASIDDPVAGSCYDIDDGGSYAPRSGRMIVYDTEGGGCPPAGGEAVGSAVPAVPNTFCCTQ